MNKIKRLQNEEIELLARKLFISKYGESVLWSETTEASRYAWRVLADQTMKTKGQLLSTDRTSSRCATASMGLDERKARARTKRSEF